MYNNKEKEIFTHNNIVAKKYHFFVIRKSIK